MLYNGFIQLLFMIPILPQNPGSLRQAADLLRGGGAIAHAADTCYGLAGDFMNPVALRKIQQLKGREAQKPMSVMWPLSQRSRLKEYAALDEFSAQACLRLLPGPVTLLLPKAPGVPGWYFPEADRLGVRIPDDEGAQALLEAFGGPLITTSANLSGQPLCRTAQEVARAFEGQEELLPLILESSRPLGHLPSTVIEVSPGRLRIVRQGPWGEGGIRGRMEGLKFGFGSSY